MLKPSRSSVSKTSSRSMHSRQLNSWLTRNPYVGCTCNRLMQIDHIAYIDCILTWCASLLAGGFYIGRISAQADFPGAILISLLGYFFACYYFLQVNQGCAQA
eukprot:GHRQ01015358.1.p1 GENE.GHRQ01015358.1~~GHRQ01015358.1.p1  ORF type:complete len:103 (-),score=22.48 GHRQ01015358.1:1020-1328(-)